MSLTEYLKGAPMASLALYTHPKLVTVGVNAPLSKAGELLRENNIYALPVMDSDGKPVGLVDLQDIVSFLCKQLKGDGEWTAERRKQVIEHHQKESHAYFDTPVSALINSSGNDPYLPLSADDTSVYDAIARLTKGARRIPVTDGQEIIAVISPSLIIRYLAQHVADPVFARVFSMKVAEMPTKHVVSVKGSDLVVDALMKMNDQGVASVAIVDNNHHLYSTMTLKDLRIVTGSRSFDKLFRTVDDFVLEVRRSTPRAIFPAIHCHPEDALERVILRLAATRIHRMFVENPETKQIINVVSLRDILAEVIKD